MIRSFSRKYKQPLSCQKVILELSAIASGDSKATVDNNEVSLMRRLKNIVFIFLAETNADLSS